VDIAQDLLLRDLSKKGFLTSVAIKGGTALRKLYAGNEGRFSLDLDFALVNMAQRREDVSLDLVAAVQGLRLGPFTYGVKERRGKWSITFESPFVRESTLATKLDFSAACWLAPIERRWVPMPVHQCYGGELPAIQTVRLEENIAEKIARLNRVTTARDMYDLAWIATQSQLWNALDKALIRRLAVLKIWSDAHGVHATEAQWGPAHTQHAFDPDVWLRSRSEDEFDMQDIGALAVPVPTAKELSSTISSSYAFLHDLDAQETRVACADARDRSLVLKLLEDLPGHRLAGGLLY
jgi:predicted nucleotidyltransferase component of viral defense system